MPVKLFPGDSQQLVLGVSGSSDLWQDGYCYRRNEEDQTSYRSRQRGTATDDFCYNGAANVGREKGAGSCPDELVTPATAYRTPMERMESNDGSEGGEPDTTTAKEKPCTPHPSKNREVTQRSVRLEPRT